MGKIVYAAWRLEVWGRFSAAIVAAIALPMGTLMNNTG
jgi:uncharacterized membrane protein (DUF2068 family)